MCGLSLKDPRAGQAWAAREPDYRTFFCLLEVPSHLVALSALQGDFGAGARVLDDMQKALEALGQPGFGFWPCEPGLFRLYRGEWEEARRLLHAGLDWARQSHDHRVAAPAAQLLGRVYAELAEYPLAEEHLQWALDLFRRATDVLGELSLLPHLCQVSLCTGQRAKAGEYLAQAQRILARPPDWAGLRADVFLAEALVEAADDRWDAAEVAFGRAAAVCQQYGLPWDEARVYYEWGKALLRGEAGFVQREQAAGLLRRALALWEPMGAAPYAERCRALVAPAG